MKKIAISFVLWYLRFFARIAVRLSHAQIIGIAGSVGKSSTRNVLDASLQFTHAVKSVHGNTETGVPLGLLGIEPHGYGALSWLWMLIQAPFGVLWLRGAEYVIVEMGIDAPENMEYLLGVVQPDIAISLNVGATHTQLFEQLLSAEQKLLPAEAQRDLLLRAIADEDTKIIRDSGCRLGIYNADDSWVSEQITSWKEKNASAALWTFSREEKSTGNAWLVDSKISSHGTEFHIGLRAAAEMPESAETAGAGAAQAQVVALSFPTYVLPEVYWENIAVALLTVHAVGLSIADAITSLEEHFSIPPSRASVFPGIRETLIIDSSYNASRIAIDPFLDLLDHIGKEEKRPTIFVLGDIRELGQEAQVEHEALLPRIRETADYVYCVGPLTQQYIVPALTVQPGRVQGIQWFANAEILGEWLTENAPDRAVICIKGSQNEIFLEEAIPYLLLNKNDAAKLTRQEPYWHTIKKKYFNSVQSS